MRYYCNICRKDITKEEFLYSVNKFDKPLCREHQRTFQQKNIQKIEQHVDELEKEIPQTYHTEQYVNEYQKEYPQENSQDINETQPASFKDFIKKFAVATGKGIVKGVKTIVDASAKKIQIQKWKDQILRRLNKGDLYRICREKNIATRTTRHDLKEDKRSGEMYWKDYTHNYTHSELVSRIKHRVSLDDIISFAKRNHINIRDILSEIDQKKSEWKVKQITEVMKEEGNDLLLELEKAIHEFKPLRRYDQEIYYQDGLASYLQSKFPETDIEIGRGSTRPDIVVQDIAIEVKGPTYDNGLQTISDKCMRYQQYFPQGLICVLFNVQVYPQRYEDWLRGMKNTFPNVIVIKK